MAHFNRIRAPGMWVLGSVLDPAEMEQMDADHFGSVNGDGGGVYAPSSPITIGGSGLTVSGAFTATSAAITIPSGKTLTIASGGTFATASGSTTTLGGDATLNNVLTVASGAGHRIDVAGSLLIKSGGEFTIEPGSTAEIDPDAELSVNGTSGHLGYIKWKNFSVGEFQSGSTLNIATGAQQNILGTLEIKDDAVVNINGTSGHLAIVTLDTFSAFHHKSANETWFSGSGATFASGSTVTHASGSSEVYSSGSTVSGTLTDSTTRTRTGATKHSGSSAYVTGRPGANGSNSDITINPLVREWTNVPTLTAPRTWTLDDGPAGESIEHTIYRNCNGTDTNDLIISSTAGVMAQFDGAASGNQYVAAMTFFWGGSDWKVKGKWASIPPAIIAKVP